MKVLRHPIASMYLVFIVLVVVALLYVSTTAELVSKINSHSTYPEILFSPDGRTLVSEGQGRIRLIDSDSGQILSIHTGHSDGISSKINKLVFLEDGKTLASAREDGTILLWDWERIVNRDN